MTISETIVADTAAYAALCTHLAACPVFGLDTEFVGEDSYHPELCLVQVATPQGLYLVDPFALPDLDDFWKIVVNPAHTVVVHAGKEEVRLCRHWSGQAPGKWFDLQIAAGLVGLGYPMGHGNLVGQVLGIHLSKGETRTEWRHRPLTKAQIHYAFDDVRHLLALWQELTNRLTNLGRMPWAEEEFARELVQIDQPEDDDEGPQEKWRKVRGVGSLDRRRLAIIRALFRWRDQFAAQVNRPPRVLVRDDLLVEIARRLPKSPHDMEMIRGVARKLTEPMFQVIETANALPVDQCPERQDRIIDPPQFGWLLNLLTASVGDFCARHHLAPSLTATNSELRQVLRSHMNQEEPPAGNPLLHGWRAQFVLPHVQALLTGNRWVRIAAPRADAPLEYRDAD